MKNLTEKNKKTLSKAELLKGKIKELLAYNDIEPDYSYGSTSQNSLDRIMQRQEAIQGEIDDLARELDTLMGRQIRFPMGDSHAFYIITKVTTTQVQITWVRYCDAWQDDRTGYQGMLNKDYAMQKVKGDDATAKLFPTRLPRV
jgi:hypothetical protein